MRHILRPLHLRFSRSRAAYALAALLLIATCAVPAAAAQTRTRALSGWFDVTTPEGWRGRRYMDGDEIFAEEFDTRGGGRIDVWRFYRNGVLSSEERDLNGDGRVDYQSRWDPRSRRLLWVKRDTNNRGVNDLEIEAAGDRRWEIREDRNLDGITDRVLIVNAPNNFFEWLGMDLSRQRDVVDSIPKEYWYELQADDSFTSVITDRRRYSRGQFTQYGEWENGNVSWRRVPPDFAPPPPPPPAAPVYGDPHGPNCPIPGCTVPICRVEPSNAPITNSMLETPASGAFEPYPAPASPLDAPPDGPVRPAAPAARDRTRYEGLPPGDSAARSLPAPMRPPGEGRR